MRFVLLVEAKDGTQRAYGPMTEKKVEASYDRALRDFADRAYIVPLYTATAFEDEASATLRSGS